MIVLGMVPARGGSKALPGKNIKTLDGKPLLQYPLEAARASEVVDRIILSTDDEEIAAVARSIGLEVPFMRPEELARDDSPMIDAALHALDALEAEGFRADALLVLQPTSPFRTPEHIRTAVELLGDNDSVCSVVAVPKDANPYTLMKQEENGYLGFIMPEASEIGRRQDLPTAYRRDGTIFLTRTHVLREQRTFYGERCVPYPLSPDEALNIDTPEDWQRVEERLHELPRH